MPRPTLIHFSVLCLTLAACDGDDGGADTAADTTTATDGATGSAANDTMAAQSDEGAGAPSTGAEPGTDGPGPDTTATTTDPTATDGGGTTTADADSADTEASEETGTPVGCYDYDAFAPTTVSYREDVMPILAARCSGCHSNPDASVYYGMGGTSEAEAVAIYDIMLEGEPKQAPHLSFVTPGDPLRSYMMAKMEYDDPGGTCSEIVCSEPGCDLQAPPAAQLPEPELAVMRSWILGGALDD